MKSDSNNFTMATIASWWKRRKLRKAKESLAYWTGVVRGFEAVGTVFNHQRDEFYTARGNVEKYKIRVQILENEN